MVVLANRRLGPAVELIVSARVGSEILGEIALAARPMARARWEIELVGWLDRRAKLADQVLDVAEIAWTPEHFPAQRQFLLEVIARAAWTSYHAPALDHLRRLIEAHPRDSVQFGRRWQYE